MAGVTWLPLWIYTPRKGYAFSRSMTTDLISNALENAYQTQQPQDGLVFHSDLGSQYTSDEFAKMINSYHMTYSFSHKGCPYDNACIELFPAIYKKEEVNHVSYINFYSAKVALFQYMEGWYNRKRILEALIIKHRKSKKIR